MSTSHPLDDYHPTANPLHARDLSPDPDGLTRAELEAIVDDILTPIQAAFWRKLHGPDAGRTAATTLAGHCGYTVTTPGSIRQEVREIVGKIEERGVSRSRAFQIMTGFTRDRVAQVLSDLLDSDDEKVRAKVADTAARCLGMGTVSSSVTVNVGVQINARIARLVDDDAGD